MTRSFEAAPLRPDGTAGNVRYGHASTENGAAHIAIRLSNRMQCNTCVVEVMRDGTEKVIQRITYYGGNK